MERFESEYLIVQEAVNKIQKSITLFVNSSRFEIPFQLNLFSIMAGKSVLLNFLFLHYSLKKISIIEKESRR